MQYSYTEKEVKESVKVLHEILTKCEYTNIVEERYPFLLKEEPDTILYYLLGMAGVDSEIVAFYSDLAISNEGVIVKFPHWREVFDYLPK